MREQIEFRFWPRHWLKTAIDDYMMSREALKRSEGTLDDYRTRGAWLLQPKILGERTPLASITYEQLEELARKHGPDGTGALLYETLRQRFKFLRQVMTYACKRKIITKDDVIGRVELPHDVVRAKPVPSVSQMRELRLSLPPGRFRWVADFFFWTGHHNADAWSFAWWMLEPDYVWTDSQGKEVGRGRYWRRNQKNRRCESYWFPMEPELREAVIELFEANPDRRPERLVTGRVWNLKRTFDAAADRAGLPRFSAIRMRAGFARMLRSRHGREYVRLAMGHEGTDSKLEGGVSTRPAILERHYLGPSPDLFLEELSSRTAPPG